MNQQHDAPRSDTAFPSLVVMGMCLALIIVLLGFTGWKIIGLEDERAAVQRERAILVRDIETNKQLREELPQLEMRHDKLTAGVANLEGTRKEFQKIADDASNLRGKNIEVQSQLDAANKELARVRNELGADRQLVATTKEELETLQNQEASLRSKIDEQRKKADEQQKIETTLTANIQSLERRQTDVQNSLARMAEDQKVVEDFRKSVTSKIDSMASQLQASLTKVDSVNTAYERQATEVRTTTGKLDTAMQDRLKTMDGHIASFSQMVTQGGDAGQALQEQVKSLTLEYKRLDDTLRAFDEQVQPLQALGTQAGSLAAQIKKIQADVTEFQNIVSSLSQQDQTLAAATKNNSEALSRLIDKLQKNLDTLSAAIQDIQATKQTHPSDTQ